jgi:hypothetical protein
MKLSYIILAHKYPEQLLRLVNSLARNNAFFYIHIDKKADISIFRNVLSKSHAKYLEFIKREDSRWGGVGILKAILNGIITMLHNQDKFERLILLSGQDYPIKSVNYIQEYFRKNADKNFIDYFELPHKGWINGGMNRIERSHCYFRGRLYNYPPYEAPKGLKDKFLYLLFGLYFPKVRIFPKGLKPFGGSDWWCITTRAVKYIIKFLNERPDFMKFYRYTFSPAEGFFQTILLNSNEEQLLETIVNNDLRYIDWSQGGRHPKILTTDDFDLLEKSDDIFARKFDISTNNEILNMIDNKILNT